MLRYLIVCAISATAGLAIGAQGAGVGATATVPLSLPVTERSVERVERVRTVVVHDAPTIVCDCGDAIAEAFDAEDDASAEEDPSAREDRELFGWKCIGWAKDDFEAGSDASDVPSQRRSMASTAAEMMSEIQSFQDAMHAQDAEDDVTDLR